MFNKINLANRIFLKLNKINRMSNKTNLPQTFLPWQSQTLFAKIIPKVLTKAIKTFCKFSGQSNWLNSFQWTKVETLKNLITIEIISDSVSLSLKINIILKKLCLKKWSKVWFLISGVKDKEKASFMKGLNLRKFARKS